MNHVTAFIISLIPAFLLYLATDLLFNLNHLNEHVNIFGITAFLIGMISSYYFSIKNKKTSLQILNKGFLVGTFAWIVISIIGVLFHFKIFENVSVKLIETDRDVSTVYGLSMIGIGFTFGVCGLCLLGFIITKRILKKKDLSNLNQATLNLF